MKSSLISGRETVALAAISQCSHRPMPFSAPMSFMIRHVHSQQQRSRESRRRHLSSATPKDAPVQLSAPIEARHALASAPPAEPMQRKKAPLATLSLSQVLRTYMITSVSSSPRLLEAMTALLRSMLESKNPLFRIDTNPILRLALWETFYKQFCAGENNAQVAKVCGGLRSQGYGGVILEYAREVLKDAEGDEAADVAAWKKGVLDSIDMSVRGDFIGLKWSGMGPAAMNRMKFEQPPSQAMDEAMHAVCKAAEEKEVALLPAAEETWNLNGFHAWSLGLQRKYNVKGRGIVYNTYQAYLKQTAGTLSEHLSIAKSEGFTLCAKLVRGAYLGSEDRELIWPNIEGTHHAYDATMSALLERKYNDFLKPASSSADSTFPAINVVLATHNAASVNKALELRKSQRANGEQLTPLSFAQLQGMADEVSVNLIEASKSKSGQPDEMVLKCTTWGTMHECLNYLLRRAAENKDAAGRTTDTRIAMQEELLRRFKSLFGLA